MNISILRTVFDKICGRSLLDGRPGPKRAQPLPRILSREDIESLVSGARDFRETLLLGLLYGCGLKIGEACALKWADVLPGPREIRITGSWSTCARAVPMPQTLRALLGEGKQRFGNDAWVFPGRRPRLCLSTRMAERIVQRCVRRLGLPQHVASMSLRHTYAVHALEAGLNIRELQVRLGHSRLETTMLYQRCLLPEHSVSPLDTMAGEAPAPLKETIHPTDGPSSRSPSTPPPGAKRPIASRLSTWLRIRMGLSPG
jgi:integrase